MCAKPLPRQLEGPGVRTLIPELARNVQFEQYPGRPAKFLSWPPPRAKRRDLRAGSSVRCPARRNLEVEAEPVPQADGELRFLAALAYER